MKSGEDRLKVRFFRLKNTYASHKSIFCLLKNRLHWLCIITVLNDVRMRTAASTTTILRRIIIITYISMTRTTGPNL